MVSDARSLDWEADIYGKGKQLNIWPFTEVISALYREKSSWPHRWRPRLLEIGCGAGNNLWGLTEGGFDCVGIDPSPSAVEFARDRFRELGLGVEVHVAGGQKIPFEDESFDFVLDRAAVCQVPKDEIPSVLSEVNRVLKPGGVFYSFGLFSEEHSDAAYGLETQSGSFDHFSQGIFQGVGLTTFFNVSLIRELFSDFENVTIDRSILEHSSGWRAEEFSVRCARATKS